MCIRDRPTSTHTNKRNTMQNSFKKGRIQQCFEVYTIKRKMQCNYTYSAKLPNAEIQNTHLPKYQHCYTCQLKKPPNYEQIYKTKSTKI